MSNEESAPRRITLLAVAFEGSLGLLAWILGLLTARPPWQQIAWTPDALLWGLAATLPMVLLLLIITHYPVGPLQPLARLVDELIVPLFRPCTLPEMLFIAAVAGLGEEMFFRGLIQAAVSARFGWVVGLTAASVLFGLMHPLTVTYAVLAGLIGLYLGWLLLASENLLVPIVVHAVYDFFALVYLVRWRQPT